MQQFKVLDFKGLKRLYLQEIVKVAIVFFVIQIGLIYMDMNLYISCIYCPLIFLYKRNLNHRFIKEQDYNLIYKHVFIYLFIVLFSILNYKALFLWLYLVYFLVYAILINKELRKKSEIVYFANSKLLTSLFMYFIFLEICVTILRLFEFYLGNQIGFSIQFMLLGTLFMNVVFSVVGLIALNKEKIRIIEAENANVRSELGLKIIEFFEKSDQYLKPNFTIKDLSIALGVPKAVVSELVNREIKMSFYTLVAKYRIEYSKQILLTNEHFTIESIVEQCGFNSRTTFNKYFLQVVGITPSEYRKEQLGNIETIDK